MKRLIFSIVLMTHLMVSIQAGKPDPATTIDRKKMKPRGKYFEAVVPDTLDLAERARLSVNALTGNVDPDNYYAVIQGFNYGPEEVTTGGMTWNLTCKNARALPKMRAMCGSDANIDIEYGMMLAILNQVHEDGQVYFPDLKQEGAPPDTSYPLVNAVVAMACKNWYERDGNETWKDWISLIAEGLKKAALVVEDRAYFPPECGYGKDGEWHFTERPNAKPFYDYHPPAEPDFDQQAFEGSIKFEQSQTIRALTLDYIYRNDDSSLEKASQIARFCLKPGMWEETQAEDEVLPGNEHGRWAGHFHGNLTTLFSLFDLGIATGDEKIKQIVREGYDQARRHGLNRMGFLLGWTYPLRFRRWESLVDIEEPCAVGDLMLLGSKLSDAGMGDYWDDVDYAIRNHWAEQQLQDPDKIRAFCGRQPENDALIDRFMGSFGPAGINRREPYCWACCTANASIGLYYAWEGITRFSNGVATVNMFLNRAAPWLDVDSYLPYEGKVIIRNKKARTLIIRIPGWVNREELRCFVNKKQIEPAFAGGQLVLPRGRKKAVVRIEFPLEEKASVYTHHGIKYTMTFRGSTLVKVTPDNDDDSKMPIYQREHMRSGDTPMQTVTRFVADKLIPINDFNASR